MPESPRFLDACELLSRREDCESVYFTQLLDLVREYEPGRFAPVVHPADLIHTIAEFDDRLPTAVAKAQALKGLLGQAEDLTPEIHRGVARRIEAWHRKPREHARGRSARDVKGEPSVAQPRFRLADERFAEIAYVGIPAEAAPIHARSSRIGLSTLSVVQATSRELLKLLEEIRLAAAEDADLRPTLAIGVRYRQEWCSLGYNRGDLIRSIPLAADARKEIVVKTWRVRKERREENESVEENISNEYIGDEKWSLAVQKQTSVELNQSLDANLKASGDVTIPVKKVPVKVGAEGGASSSTDVNVKNTVTETEEAIKNTTVKAANSLKSLVSSSVETSEERGFESTVTDTLVNPNKCHSLTYHFFEIIESFRVRTRVEELAPFVMLPLPYPNVTKEWLLCHECLLRKHLPCSDLYSGFGAAKRILANERLGLFTAGGGEGGDLVDGMLRLIERMVDSFNALRYAGILPGPPAPGGGGGGGGGDLGGSVGGVVDWWVERGEEIVNWGKDVLGQDDTQDQDPNATTDDTGDDPGGIADAAEQVGEWVEEGTEKVGEMAGEAWGAIKSGANQLFASTSAASTAGGTGSFIYYEMTKIAAPEIISALTGLEAAYQAIHDMPEGPARTQAIFTALEGFFATLGNVDEAFRKVDIALLIALISVIGAGAMSAGLLAALVFPLAVSVTGGAAAALAVATGLATAAGVSVAGASAALTGYGLEQMAEVDLHPDDRGLKAGVHGLFALYRQLGQAVSLPVLPQDPTPEQVAAHERMRREQEQHRRELAEAQVDLDRLICHIKENIAHYFQVVAAATPTAEVARIVEEKFHIPSHAVDLRFSHFVGNRVGLRVLDRRWLRQSGLDLAAELKALRQSGLAADGEGDAEVVLPTRGMLVEPRLGECDACDDFIKAHRKKDLAMKDVELGQARLESERLQKRLNANLLGDPTPFESASSLSVDVDGDTPGE